MGFLSSDVDASVSANQSMVQRLIEIFVGNEDADLLLQGDGWISAMDSCVGHAVVLYKS